MWSEERDRTLLDYYTKNMTLHATITVAIIFGLFSVLGIVSSTSSWITWAGLAIGYYVLVVFGLYEIGRFLHYGDEAKKKAELFGAKEKPAEGEHWIREWFVRWCFSIFQKAEMPFLTHDFIVVIRCSTSIVFNSQMNCV